MYLYNSQFQVLYKALHFNETNMKCVCPERKNDINISNHPKIAVGYVIECDTCGIVLEVRKIENGVVETEIVDEGK